MEKTTPPSGSVGDIAPLGNMMSAGRASSPNEPLPTREKLPHEIPSWVEQGARHFITINCKQRGSPTLLQHDVATRLLENGRFYDRTGRWYLWLMLVMPDHIHFIATFDLSKGLTTTVSAWKRYQKKTLGIEWQSDFFEHRLRNQPEFDEKATYIRMNPVRQGLVTNPEKWPHILDRNSIDGGSVGDVALPKNKKLSGGANSQSEPSHQEKS